MGVPAVTFAAPVEKRVYGWAIPGTDQETRPEHSGVERDLDLYCREPFAVPKDRVTIQGVAYLAVGWPEEYDFGPFGFTPGCRINLKRVVG
ncbi:hypothetical protein [Leucobacter luti]|nr:hypothetical protein [Leucobacter luti]